MRTTPITRLAAGLAFLVLACSSDSTGPKTIDAPTGVTVTMASATSARITWTASAQAELVKSYNVFRNGTKVGETTETFYVDAGLAEQTQYKYTISANGKDGQVSALSLETASSSITVPDATAPRVTSTNPAASATGVARSSKIDVTFSEAMKASTINATTFSASAGGASVAGTVTYDNAAHVAELTPSSSLPNASVVTVTVGTGVTDQAGNAIAAPFTFSFTVRDEIAPTVESVSPANQATGVSTATSVSAVFSKAMDASTINASTFTVRTTAGGSGVAGAVAYDAGSRTATFTPSAALAEGTGYTVTVSTGVKDASGNALASAFSSTFTTVVSVPVDNTPPTIVSSTPANGATNVAVTSAIRVTFSEDMNASTLSTGTFGLTVNGAQVSGSVSYDVSSRTATFAPSAGLLANGQSYVATVTTGVKDVAGNAMAANFVYSFTTAQAVDNTPPAIVSRNPSPGATGVATNTVITIGFSEAMNASTINTSTITLTNGGSGVAGSVSYDSNTRVATFTPSVTLANAQTYTVTVTTGVRDAAGNALASNDVFSFTTAGAAQVSITGMTNPTDGWWQATTAGSVGIHFHVVFAQSGSSLSLGPECPGGLNDRCITLAQNQAGADAIGPASPGYVWVLLTSVTGSYTGSQISFTMTNANGKTFTFNGTVNSTTSMTGTISGATLPSETITFSRPAP